MSSQVVDATSRDGREMRWLSLDEAAARLGHDHAYVRRLGRRGHLATRLVYDPDKGQRCTVVSVPSLEGYIAARETKRDGTISIGGVAHVTVSAAARMLNISPKGVRHHLSTGALAATAHTEGYGHREAVIPASQVVELRETLDRRKEWSAAGRERQEVSPAGKDGGAGEDEGAARAISPVTIGGPRARGLLRYDAISPHPELVCELTGRGVDEIDALVGGLPRRRTAGRAHLWPLSAHDEVLLALLYRHRRVGQPALAELFGISRSTVDHIRRHIFVALGWPKQELGQFVGCTTDDLLALVPALASHLVRAEPAPENRATPPANWGFASPIDVTPPARPAPDAAGAWDVAHRDYVACEEEAKVLRRRLMALRARLVTELYDAAAGDDKESIPPGIDRAAAAHALVEVALAHVLPEARARVAAAVLLQRALGCGNGEMASLLGVAEDRLTADVSTRVATLTPLELSLVWSDWLARLRETRETGGLAEGLTARVGIDDRAWILLQETAARYEVPVDELKTTYTPAELKDMPATRAARIAASLLLRSLLHMSWRQIAELLTGHTPTVLRHLASMYRSRIDAADLAAIEGAWQARVKVAAGEESSIS